jgi:hypothetical protein
MSEDRTIVLPADATTSSRIRPSRAVELLARVVAGGYMNRETLARELSLRLAKLERYETGAEAMPLNHQARLALLVIAKIPELMKQGNRLRGQVAAAIAYHNRESSSGEVRSTLF